MEASVNGTVLVHQRCPQRFEIACTLPYCKLILFDSPFNLSIRLYSYNRGACLCWLDPFERIIYRTSASACLGYLLFGVDCQLSLGYEICVGS